MKYRPIVGTLGYILSKDKKQVLLVHRTLRLDDDHYGKYNGLGGKMHETEDVASCMTREIFEESQLKVLSMSLRGVLNWTGFGPKKEEWLGFIFLITDYENTPLEVGPEGPLVWRNIDELMQLNMWEGDRYFLPLVFDEDPRVFYGFMPYDGEKVLDFSYTRM